MKCQYDNCFNSAKYGLSYENAIYCKNHKLENYKLVSQFCKIKGCNKLPNFNYEDSKGRLYCFNHKLDGMISKDNRVCKHENCKLRPNFNYENESKPIYCVNHKLDGMISKDNRVCKHEKCKLRPNFNYENESNPIYCFNHKLEGMISKTNQKCEYEGCNIRPSFNFENNVGVRFCFSHKLEGMISKDSRKCKSNLCFGTRGNENYNGYCTHCFQNLFPEDPLNLQIRKKSKELIVRNYLFEKFVGFIHDKPLWTGNCDCTHRRRIDFRKLIGNTILCIEVDENQHSRYNKNDEEIRYDDLYMLHSGKFIFIRFNPDKFKYNGKTCNPKINSRLSILNDEINKQFNRIENELNEELVEIIKLFYDD
jgi:hypothetical protein